MVIIVVSAIVQAFMIACVFLGLAVFVFCIVHRHSGIIHYDEQQTHHFVIQAVQPAEKPVENRLRHHEVAGIAVGALIPIVVVGRAVFVDSRYSDPVWRHPVVHKNVFKPKHLSQQQVKAYLRLLAYYYVYDAVVNLVRIKAARYDIDMVLDSAQISQPYAFALKIGALPLGRHLYLIKKNVFYQVFGFKSKLSRHTVGYLILPVKLPDGPAVSLGTYMNR